MQKQVIYEKITSDQNWQHPRRLQSIQIISLPFCQHFTVIQCWMTSLMQQNYYEK